MKALTIEVLTKIVEIQSAIAANLSVAHVMDIATESAQDITGAQGAAVEIAEGDEMVYRAATGICVGHVGVRLKIASSLSGLCVRQGVSLCSLDTETDDRVDRTACQRVGIRSMLVVPLKRGEKTIGAIKVMAKNPGAFSDSDADVLHMMAGFIASSMLNAAAY